MRVWIRLVLVVMLLTSGLLVVTPAHAQVASSIDSCRQGYLPHGARSLICIPASGWNGDLVVWAHGYVPFNAPLDFYHIDLPNGTSLIDLTHRLGMAFATTSYRRNGLAILEGADDIRELVAAFPASAGRRPNHVFLTGASEGGIITTKLIEQSPELFSGGLALCGPIGNFRKQLDYWGDFRVLFDYFFPDVIPGSSVSIPQSVIDGWDSIYVPRIKSALAANPRAAAQLIKTSKAAIDPLVPSTTEKTTLQLLWYNVFATNDGLAQFGGNPFDNRLRWYSGSDDDFTLNARVKRFSASATALAQVARYETTGQVTKPLVTMHTTGDEIIPVWQQTLYSAKARPTGSGVVAALPAAKRYGHCNFTDAEALLGFTALILNVAN